LHAKPSIDFISGRSIIDFHSCINEIGKRHFHWEFNACNGLQSYPHFIHNISTIFPTEFSTDLAQTPVNTGRNLKYFLLDSPIIGCNMATQSRLLTGTLTGTGRWDRRGDASSVGQKERKAAVQNVRSRSRKACLGLAATQDRVIRIKTDDA